MPCDKKNCVFFEMLKYLDSLEDTLKLYFIDEIEKYAIGHVCSTEKYKECPFHNYIKSCSN